MKNVFLTILLCLCAGATVLGQNEFRPAQITFFHPIGSNGINSMRYTNTFSLNVLFGMQGGVNGLEIGSIGNFNRGDVNGLQVAGVTNITQGALHGLAVSGVANITTKSSSGAMISGVLNVATKPHHGIQLGVFNYAQKIKGVQVGVFNFVADGEGALPIGLFNIVGKNGYYAVEATAGEAIYSNVNVKFGVERFYTILKGGFTTFNGQEVYSYGLGFGTKLISKEGSSLSLDLSSSSLYYDGNGGKLNLLNKADLLYAFKIGSHFSVLLGPSANVYISEVNVDNAFSTLNIPYTIFTRENRNNTIFGWVGGNLGMSWEF